ncbi:MAG: DUF72 domain-containing protein, partial [Rhodothermales bacterium]|nr:DUF72 domain-containing protein [Rhodothermales bacterium]
MMQVPDSYPRKDQLERIERYDFRGIHQNIRFGTASDRYAGWIGQIYPASYATRTKKRTRKLAGVTYEERTVPIDSVVDYFQHFSVLEIDFTYYRPLVEEDGSPSSNTHVLQRYVDAAPDNARFILKVPNLFFSRRVMRRVEGKSKSVVNDDYLNRDKYLVQFHRPAIELVGDRLKGLLFEQEYQRKAGAPTSDQNVEELDSFFEAVPREVPIHLEIRSPHLLDEPYFDWLETCGLGHVFSHWTWLPPLRKQWRMSGERFTEADGEAMVRLLTPLKMPYAKAYAKTHPFDQVVQSVA